MNLLCWRQHEKTSLTLADTLTDIYHFPLPLQADHPRKQMPSLALPLFWHDLIDASWLLLTLQLIFVEGLWKKWVDVSVILGITIRLMSLWVSMSFLSNKKHHLQCCGLAAMPQEISAITSSERNIWTFFFQPRFKNKFSFILLHSELAYFDEIPSSRRNMFCHTLFNQLSPWLIWGIMHYFSFYFVW